MGIGINDDGWRKVSERLCSDEIAERMEIPNLAVAAVLDGTAKPDIAFVAAALRSFPFAFGTLFIVLPLAGLDPAKSLA